MPCIPKKLIASVRKSIFELSKKDPIGELANLSSKERISLLKKSLNEEDAIRFNKSFEKAVVSKRVSALSTLIEKELSEKYRKNEINALNRTFNSLDEFNSFVETKINSFAEKKLGTALTEEEVKKFTEIGKKMYEEGAKLGSDFIDLTSKEGYDKALRFGKAYKEMEDYTHSISPSSAWRSFINRIGRTSMLTSIKTPLLNIESNIIGGVTSSITRRASSWQLTKTVEKEVAKEYLKNTRKFFSETGIDVSRMISFQDTVAGSGRMVGENVTDGKFLKGYTDFVFNTLLSKPDVHFGSYAFMDSASLNASKYKNSTEVFKDATLINPKTDEGKLVRTMAIADARMATYTNESWSSSLLESTRKTLNKVGGIGDILMPFVKTPANVAELGLDYAGLGFIKGGVKGAKLVWAKYGKKEVVDRVMMQQAMNDIARAGLGMTTAAIIASQINADDFMGAYDPQRIKIDQLSNTSYNAIKIGDKWVSMDYFGSLSSPLVGYLYAKKYNSDKAAGYVSGATLQYLSAMGLKDVVVSVGDTLGKIDPENKAAMFKTFGDDLKRNVTDIIVSRMVPGISYDLARATDEFQRDTTRKKYTLFGVNMDSFAQKIPFLRENLPVKYDVLGRIMHEESAVESLLFGARVRTSTMDNTVKEIYRLRNAGETPTIKDLRFMNSTNVDKLKAKTGERFYEIARGYGETLSVKLGNAMISPGYSQLSDEKKKARLDKICQDLYETTLTTNGIPYK